MPRMESYDKRKTTVREHERKTSSGKKTTVKKHDRRLNPNELNLGNLETMVRLSGTDTYSKSRNKLEDIAGKWLEKADTTDKKAMIEALQLDKFPYEHGDFITINEKEDAEKLGFKVNKTNIEGMFKILKKEKPEKPFEEIHPNTSTTVRFAYKDFEDGNVTSKTINRLIESIEDSENSGRISDSNYLKEVLSYVSNYSSKPTIEPIKRSGYTENIGDVYGADNYIANKLNISDLGDYEEKKNEYKKLLRNKLGNNFILSLNEAEELTESNYHYTLEALKELGMVKKKKFTKEQDKSREKARIKIIEKIQESKDKLKYLNTTISTPKSKLQAINDVEFWEKQLESMGKR